MIELKYIKKLFLTWREENYMETKEKVMLDMPVSKIRAKGFVQFKKYWKPLLAVVFIQIVLINVVGYFFAITPAGGILGILLLLLAPLDVGVCIAVLKTARGSKATIDDLFFPYKAYFLKALGLMCLISLFTLLWGLTGIIPGLILLGAVIGSAAKGGFVVIIVFAMVIGVIMLIPAIMAVYRYSQAIYVFINHPELRVMECIEKSKELTADNKKKLFFLDLSFIGWWLVASIPVIVAVLFTIGKIQAIISEFAHNWTYQDFDYYDTGYITGKIVGSAIVILIAVIISVLLSILVSAYNAVAQAVAHDILTGRADKDGEYEEQPYTEELTNLDKIKAKLAPAVSNGAEVKAGDAEAKSENQVAQNNEADNDSTPKV